MDMIDPFTNRETPHRSVGDIVGMLLCWDLLQVAPADPDDPTGWWLEHKSDPLDKMRKSLEPYRTPPPPSPNQR
jgi:hypothetical protein